MTSFSENLIAEAIGLVVGLAITYLIVEALLRRAVKRRWQPSGEWLKGNLKSQAETTTLVWAFEKDPTLLPADLTFTPQVHAELHEALRTEVAELERSGPSFVGVRPDSYWLNIARGLGSSDGFVERGMSRGAWVLREDMKLIEQLLEAEEAHAVIASFRADDSMFGQDRVADPLRWAVFRALKAHLTISDLLVDAKS